MLLFKVSMTASMAGFMAVRVSVSPSREIRIEVTLPSDCCHSWAVARSVNKAGVVVPASCPWPLIATIWCIVKFSSTRSMPSWVRTNHPSWISSPSLTASSSENAVLTTTWGVVAKRLTSSNSNQVRPFSFEPILSPSWCSKANQATLGFALPSAVTTEVERTRPDWM